MKKNTSVFLSLLLVLIASYFLYWKGEQALEKASAKFTVLAFENTDLNCNNNSLEFFIENNQKTENSYRISIFQNDQSLENYNLTVPAQSKKLIQPNSEIRQNLCSQKESFKYEIKIKDKSVEQLIYKLITLQ
jgi:outer membrane usher protein FimD/PapC